MRSVATGGPGAVTPLGSAWRCCPPRGPTGSGCSTGGPAHRSGPSLFRRWSWHRQAARHRRVAPRRRAGGDGGRRRTCPRPPDGAGRARPSWAERQRLGTDLTLVDATASLVAYVDDRGDLRLRDLATGGIGWSARSGCRAGSARRPVAGAGCCDQFGAFSATAAAWPSTCSCAVPPSRAWPWSMSGGPRPGRCPGPRGPPHSAASHAWSIDGWLFFFSGGPPPDVVTAWRPGRPTASPWTCPWTARSPPFPAAWRSSTVALPPRLDAAATTNN